MSLAIDTFAKDYVLTLKGEMAYRVTLGTDPRGNILRIDNALSTIPERMSKAQDELDNLLRQQEAAKQEVGKPFAQEAELREKSARLAELDAELNMEAQSAQGRETDDGRSEECGENTDMDEMEKQEAPPMTKATNYRMEER